ncbi:DUF1415 domain-containing protein [Persicimonas caeni]|uniref:DUF1415 domain-containing protein n=1 Tax=Persicimonas caeni TaxID=2292766 RepID=A0A4Y6PNN2_PERCE|nr:DUF1415 domain-containing protein [Persicimonas caeni]QED31115.1 DUF1415 domain-containing protein [Persicimonas caeni]
MEDVVTKTRRWLEDAVIGLNLCPFARAVYVRDEVRIAVDEARGFEDAIRRALDEADRLLQAAPDDIATTLVVFPHALSDFDEFLDAVDAVDELIERAGAAGILQLAHFHPQYQFEGTEADDLENFTNRAPYPTLHLLREAQISEGVASHPNPEAIPERNIEVLEELGELEVHKMWDRWSTD